MKKQNEIQLPTDIKTPSIEELEEAFEGDKDLVIFFITWLKNGLNATLAYKELHPNVTDHSARVLGTRKLAKVSIPILLAVYGLGVDRYYSQLSEGMDATKWNDFTGEREADHKTREAYHKKLGRLLGIEKDEGTKVSVGIINVPNIRNKYGF